MLHTVTILIRWTNSSLNFHRFWVSFVWFPRNKIHMNYKKFSKKRNISNSNANFTSKLKLGPYSSLCWYLKRFDPLDLTNVLCVFCSYFRQWIKFIFFSLHFISCDTKSNILHRHSTSSSLRSVPARTSYSRRSYDLYDAQTDASREQRTQCMLGTMAACEVICIGPLMVLR